jgi:hypothetical protein
MASAIQGLQSSLFVLQLLVVQLLGWQLLLVWAGEAFCCCLFCMSPVIQYSKAFQPQLSAAVAASAADDDPDTAAVCISLKAKASFISTHWPTCHSFLLAV